MLADGSIVFADAGRSVVWRVTREGVLHAIGPGVHAHWLALGPGGTSVYADHLRYEPDGERFLSGLVRLSISDGGTTLDDVIRPAEGARGLACGLFLVESTDLLRWSSGPSSLLTRGPLAPPQADHDRVLARFANQRGVHAVAARGGGGYLVTLDARLVAMDADGRLSTRFELQKRPTGAAPAEPLYGDDLWGVAAGPADGAWVCDPSDRRLWRVTAEGAGEVAHVSPAPWSPVGVTTRGDELVLLEAGFESPARNLGPRVVVLGREGGARVLATVPDSEGSRPYR